MRRLVVSVAVALLAAPAAGHAQQIALAQSFTVPTGPDTVLRALTVGPAGFYGETVGTPFTADIFAFEGNLLVGPSLFAQLLGSDFEGFALTPNLALRPGATYAVALVSPPNPWIRFGTASQADTYAGGRRMTCRLGQPCSTETQNDVAGFAIEFGPATVVPEPATWTLTGAGLGGVALAARRRRAAPAA